MSESVSKYFHKGKERRQTRSSSTSSAASEIHPRNKSDSSEKIKTLKEPRRELNLQKETETEDKENMSLQSSIEEINKKLDMFEKTREDINQIKKEMESLSSRVVERLEKLEGTIFEVQKNNDKLTGEVRQLKEENTSLRSQLHQQKSEANIIKTALNEVEQHGRSWNVRVFGVEEEKGSTEKVTDCVKKCAAIFNKRLGVPVTEDDIEVAHRSGRPGTGRPRPIIARFFSRQKRGLVLENRRKLKQSGVSIGEDLTRANHNLLMRCSKHSAALSAWSSNGKVLVKLKNGKIVRVHIHSNLDETFANEML